LCGMRSPMGILQPQQDSGWEHDVGEFDLGYGKGVELHDIQSR